MQNNEELPRNTAEGHKPHDWPSFDANRCSCCRQAILHGFHNVVRIQKAPERILDVNTGEYIGIDERGAGYKAVLHGRCWKDHYGHVAECEKCGTFSRVKQLADGSKNLCGCTCHKGAPECSFILDPNYAGKETIEKFNKGLL